MMSIRFYTVLSEPALLEKTPAGPLLNHSAENGLLSTRRIAA